MSYTSVAIPQTARAALSSRVVARLRLHPALAAGALALVLAWGGLLLTHHPTRLAVPKSAALRFALADRGVSQILSSVHWTRVDVTPMDSRYEILDFYRGARMVADVTVGFNGHIVVLNTDNLVRQKYAFGSNIANDGRVLALLAVAFVLMTAVWPLWRLRNLDVLIATSLALTVVFYNRGMLTLMVLVGYTALAYLAVRCAWWALGPRRRPRPAIPLYDHLTRRWTGAQRQRVMRLVLVAMAIVVAMVGFTSLHVVDVGYAVMEGGTAIVHGVLPYGHIPDVLHGDTYPFGSYLFYAPFAYLWPVHTVWDDADVTLVIAVAAALLAALALARAAGLRSAIAWLAFPPLLVTVSSGTTDVVLAAMVIGVLLLWQRPVGGMAALSGAVWFKLAPLAIVPVLLARLRGRAIKRGTAALVLTSVPLLAIMIALGGVAAPGRMLSAISFQFSRASPHTLWALIGAVPLQQLAQAGTIGLLVGAVVRIRRDGTLREDRSRIAAIAAAILLTLQFSSNYWTYMYLVWGFPLIVLSLLFDQRAALDPERDGGVT